MLAIQNAYWMYWLKRRKHAKYFCIYNLHATKDRSSECPSKRWLSIACAEAILASSWRHVAGVEPASGRRQRGHSTCRFQRAHASPEGGPAILVYYAPAFLRRQPPASARDALVLLAEVYRRARQLWPLGPLPASIDAASVTVRIDQMKELALEEVHRVVDEGTHAWVLVRGNQREATVECHPRARLAELQHMGALVLSFGGGGGAADASSPPRRRSMNARSHFTFSGHSAWVSTSDLDAWGAGTPRSSTYEGKRGQALSPEAMRRQEQLQAHRLKRQRASIDAGTPTRSISRGWKWPWSASAARADPETPLDA